ncbi:MAG: 50S ribosomal protein L11 methyltransferase [Eubacteriales bacterium]|jgi:ribosomal protein L11 methyltransferase
MTWLEVSIFTTTEGVEPLCGLLYSLGAAGLEIEDKEDFAEFIEKNTPYWDYVDEELMREKQEMPTRVKLYVSDNETGHAMLAGIREELMAVRERAPQVDFGSLEVSVRSMAEEDWANNWKQYYKPLLIGEKLLIRPTWEEVENPEGRVVVAMDPGMAFGTGTHATTSQCLAALERVVRPGDRVLDLGCGSGILAITTLLLGAEHAIGVDIDPNAVHIAGQNACINGLDPSRYEFLSGDVAQEGELSRYLEQHPADVVAANIVADVILHLTPVVGRYLKPGGTFIASGVIDMRSAEVEECFARCGFRVEERLCHKDWLCYVLKQ